LQKEFSEIFEIFFSNVRKKKSAKKLYKIFFQESFPSKYIFHAFHHPQSSNEEGSDFQSLEF